MASTRSQFETIIASKNSKLIRELIITLSTDTLLQAGAGESFESLLAKYGLADELEYLWEKRPEVRREHWHRQGFYYAKTYNHPDVIRLYQRKGYYDFYLPDKSKAVLDEAVFFGSLLVDKKIDEKKFLIENEFQEPLLFTAVQSGNIHWVRRFYVEDEINPISLLEMAILGRNSHLAAVFMSDILKHLKKPVGIIEEPTSDFIMKLLALAIKYNQNSVQVIIDVVNAIPLPDRNDWLREIRKQALTMELPDIYKELVKLSADTPDGRMPSEPITEDLGLTEIIQCELVDTKKLVIRSYLPYLKKLTVPLTCYAIVSKLIAKRDEEDLPTNILIAKYLMSFIPKEIKEIAVGGERYDFNASTEERALAVSILRDTELRHTLPSSLPNGQLFDFLSRNASAKELRTLLPIYEKFLANNKGAKISEYNYATALAFMLGEYKLAKKFLEDNIACNAQRQNPIESATFTSALQFLTMCEEANITFAPHFMEFCTNHFLKIIRQDRICCSMIFDGLLFATNITSKNGSVQSMVDAFVKINSFLPEFNKQLDTEDSFEFNLLRQNTAMMNALFKLLDSNSRTANIQFDIKGMQTSLLLQQLSKYTYMLLQILCNTIHINNAYGRMVEDLEKSIAVNTKKLEITKRQLAETQKKEMEKIAKEKADREKIEARKLKKEADKIKREADQAKKEQAKKAAETEAEKLKAQEIELQKEKEEKEKAAKLARENKLKKQAAARKAKKAENKAAKEKAQKEAEEKQALLEAEQKAAAEKAEAEIKAAEEARIRAEAEAAEREAAAKAAEAAAKIAELEAKEAAAKEAEENAAREIALRSTVQAAVLAIEDALKIVEENSKQFATEDRDIAAKIAEKKYPIPAQSVFAPVFIPSPQSSKESFIQATARKMGLPHCAADLFEKYQDRLTLTGGWVRDYLLERNPHDLDFVLFASEQEVEREFPDATWKRGKKFTTISIVRDIHKIDIKILPPAATDAERIAMLKAESGGRDFTINALHLKITRTKKYLLDFFNGQTHLKDGILQIPNADEAFGLYLLHPDRFFRLLYLNEFLHFGYSKEVQANVRKIIEDPKLFFEACKNMADSIKNQINKMVGSYGKAQTYRILVSNNLEQELIEAGVLTPVDMQEFKLAYNEMLASAYLKQQSIFKAKSAHKAVMQQRQGNVYTPY